MANVKRYEIQAAIPLLPSSNDPEAEQFVWEFVARTSLFSEDTLRVTNRSFYQTTFTLEGESSVSYLRLRDFVVNLIRVGARVLCAKVMDMEYDPSNLYWEDLLQSSEVTAALRKAAGGTFGEVGSNG
jgi:hypothetical protein